MASVYPRPLKTPRNGKERVGWYVGWYQNGRHRSKSVGPSKVVAEKVRRQIEAELVSGRFDFLNRPESVPINTSIDSYLGHIESLRKPATHVRYRDALAHFRQFMRTKYLSVESVSQLTAMHFTEYQGWRRGTRVTPNGLPNGKSKAPAFKTINIELTIFRTWLNWAIQMGQIRENPLKGLKKLKTTDSKPRRVLTKEEFAALLTSSREIEKNHRGRKGQTNLWRLLANTGMRIGEVIHLEWGDIDFKRQVIKIQRKPDWDPKTYEREIPMNAESLDVIKAAHEVRTAKDKLVFRLQTRRPLRESTVRNWLLDCAKQAEIEGMRGPHDLRHTFITMALTEFGIDLPTVQKIAGHRNLETTQIYMHPTTEHIMNSVQRYKL
jgi:site-specific recombinase XerD